VADWVAILHAGRLQVVAKLDDLKSEVNILNFSQRDTLLAPPAEFGQLDVLHKSVEGRAVRMMVRGLSPEIQAALQRDANIFDLKIVRPNLEELFIGFTQPVADGPRVEVAGRRTSDVA
jgi:ABC-2 type transport system ATP-binding protein